MSLIPPLKVCRYICGIDTLYYSVCKIPMIVQKYNTNNITMYLCSVALNKQDGSKYLTSNEKRHFKRNSYIKKIERKTLPCFPCLFYLKNNLQDSPKSLKYLKLFVFTIHFNVVWSWSVCLVETLNTSIHHIHKCL